MPERSSIREVIDLDTYPLDQPDSTAYGALVQRCRAELATVGLFDLPGFVRPDAVDRAVSALRPLIDHASFSHRRSHNIYFSATVDGLADDHPALAVMETSNRTVCADQMAGMSPVDVYEWEPLRRFLAEVLDLGTLYLMDDPLARVNVMSYRHGEALNWHFDRSQFTTTVVLQAATDGGDFEYRVGLRSDDDPNHDGVARLVAGEDSEVQRRSIAPGTLSVFTGRHTAHRVTPVEGERDRIVAVFAYFEQPGVLFSEGERIGFYGRA